MNRDPRTFFYFHTAHGIQFIHVLFFLQDEICDLQENISSLKSLVTVTQAPVMFIKGMKQHLCSACYDGYNDYIISEHKAHHLMFELYYASQTLNTMKT